jgi:hypothetical protein
MGNNNFVEFILLEKEAHKKYNMNEIKYEILKKDKNIFCLVFV